MTTNTHEVTMVVVEITGELMPRTWANFATALGHRYWAYVAEKYPRSPWTFHNVGALSHVRVNASRFAAFVVSALDAGIGMDAAGRRVVRSRRGGL